MGLRYYHGDMKIKTKLQSPRSNSRRMLGCLATALLVSLGIATSRAQDSNPTAPATGNQSLAHIDKHFIMKAAMASSNEVALSQLAADRAASADVKSLAQMMITDHTQLNSDLQALATQKNVDISKAVQKGQTDGVDSLAKESGADFDKAYAKKMVSAHKDAVSLFKKESTHGKDPDVVALAGKYLPTLQQHLEHAESVKQTVDP
jgi:putative membrane protein